MEHIDVPNDAMDGLLRARLLDVEHEAPLATVQAVVALALARDELAQHTHPLAAWWLDLDHVSAEVREVLAAERSRDDLGNLQHLDAVQWTGHGSPLTRHSFEAMPILPREACAQKLRDAAP